MTTSLGAVVRGELDRLVQHRDHCVEPFDGELLLAEERAPQIALHPLDLGQPPEQRAPLVLFERRAEPARLDRRPKPHALLVPRDVLDLVGHRPAIRLAEKREGIGQRLAGDMDAQDPCGHLGLELGSEPGLEAFGLERGISGRLAAERVEARGQVAVHAMRLDERHRGRDRTEELLRRRVRLGGRGSVAAVRGARVELADPLDDRARLELLGGVLEERAPSRVDRLGRSQVLLEQLLDEA